MKTYDEIDDWRDTHRKISELTGEVIYRLLRGADAESVEKLLVEQYGQEIADGIITVAIAAVRDKAFLLLTKPKNLLIEKHE